MRLFGFQLDAPLDIDLSGEELAGIFISVQSGQIRVTTEIEGKREQTVIPVGATWHVRPRTGIDGVRMEQDPNGPAFSPVVTFDIGPQTGIPGLDQTRDVWERRTGRDVLTVELAGEVPAAETTQASAVGDPDENAYVDYLSLEIVRETPASALGLATARLRVDFGTGGGIVVFGCTLHDNAVGARALVTLPTPVIFNRNAGGETVTVALSSEDLSTGGALAFRMYLGVMWVLQGVAPAM